MDPTNNPTPAPEPVAPQTPAPAAKPVELQTPAPVAEPVEPQAPAPAVEPIANPATEVVAPVEEPVAAPAPEATPTAPQPIVVNPTATAGSVSEVSAQSAPINNAVDGLAALNGDTKENLVSATDPITMPAPPKAPDPIEEELKAPLKAAEPVPGSIGSAISVPKPEAPEEEAQAAEDILPAGQPSETRSVSFNDPATVEEPTKATTEPKLTKPKAKNSKTTLIILTIVAIMVVIALSVVLVLQLI